MIGLSAVARAGVRSVMSRFPWLEEVTPGRFVVARHVRDCDASVRFSVFLNIQYMQSYIYFFFLLQVYETVTVKFFLFLKLAIRFKVVCFSCA